MKSSIYSPFILNSKQVTDEIWEISERKLRKRDIFYYLLFFMSSNEGI